MISPVTVEIVADLIMGRTPRFDLDIMSSARFRPGAAQTESETMVIG